MEAHVDPTLAPERLPQTEGSHGLERRRLRLGTPLLSAFSQELRIVLAHGPQPTPGSRCQRSSLAGKQVDGIAQPQYERCA